MDEVAALRLQNAELIAKNEELQEELRALREANTTLKASEEARNELSQKPAGRADRTPASSKFLKLAGPFAFDGTGMRRGWASSSPRLDANLTKGAAEALFGYCCLSCTVPYSNLLWCSRVSKAWRAKVIASLRMLTALHFTVSWDCKFFGTQHLSNRVASLKDILAALSRTSASLTSLDLSGTDTFLEGPEGCGELSRRLQGLPQLTCLCMARSDIKESVCGALAEMLQGLQRLSLVDLRHNHIGVAGCKVLAGALGRLRNLRQLHLADNSLDPSSLAEALSGMEGLEHLDIHRCIRFTNGEGSESLAASLAHHTSLKVLNFSRNFCGMQHDGRVAQALAISLTLTPNMTYLNLRHTSFANQAAFVLAKAVAQMTGLETLKLSNAAFADAGCTALASALSGSCLPCLITLDLSRSLPSARVHTHTHTHTLARSLTHALSSLCPYLALDCLRAAPGGRVGGRRKRERKCQEGRVGGREREPESAQQREGGRDRERRAHTQMEL
jgi:hypothetical protein